MDEQPDDDDLPEEKSSRTKAFLGNVWSFLKTLRGPLSLLVDLFGIGAIAVWTYDLFALPGARVVTAVYVCLTGAAFMALAVYLQWRLFSSQKDSYRARRLRRAQPTLAEAFAHLSRAAHFTADDSKSDQVRTEGNHAASRLAEVFTTVTEAPCRVTVKQVFVPEGSDRPAVQDLFRSHPDTSTRPPEQIDWVEENSDFEDLMISGNNYWYSADIMKEYATGYKNSHITRHQIRSGSFPYRSVMVTRIAGPGGGAPVSLAGFLCVDSVTPGIFRAKLDVSTAQSLAHAMYSILMWYRKQSTPPEGD